MPRTCITGNTSPGLKYGVEYDVINLENSITEIYGQTSSAITVTCVVDYSESTKFLMDMLGHSKAIGSSIQRVLPEQSGWDGFWDAQNEEKHYAIEAKLAKCLKYTGDDVLTGWPVYDQLQYEVTFVAPLYKVLEDADLTTPFTEYERFVLWTKSGAAENEKLPGGSYKLPAEGTYAEQPLGEVGVMTGRTQSLTARWLDVPYVNRFSILDAYTNKVNSAQLDWDGETYPAETVLFQTWKEIKKVNAFGRRTTDLEFTFLVRTEENRTWNKVRTGRAAPYTYSTPTLNGDLTTKIFGLADLNDLFVI